MQRVNALIAAIVRDTARLLLPIADMVVGYAPSDLATAFLWMLDCASRAPLAFDITVGTGSTRAHHVATKIVLIYANEPTGQIEPLHRAACRRDYGHFVLTLPGLIDPVAYTFDELWRAIFSRAITTRIKEAGCVAYAPTFEAQVFRLLRES